MQEFVFAAVGMKEQASKCRKQKWVCSCLYKNGFRQTEPFGLLFQLLSEGCPRLYFSVLGVVLLVVL